MKLEKWIKDNKYSYAKAADHFKIQNINPATNVNRYAKGERIPHPIIMKKIYDATNQQVTPHDFYEQYWEKKNI